MRSTPDRSAALALIALCVLLYVPLAGNYGLWDPWETHYSEVARQMLERGDFISTWWPGSPDEHAEFWSKPVLTFWLMALSLRAAGLESAAPSSSELADSWRAEWALRAPSIALSIVAVWAVFELVRRIAGRRAGLLSALVLATSSQWLLITRQAVTDMPFVAPMTAALALAGLALLDPSEAMDAALQRRRIGRLGWPHAPAFYGLLALVAVTAAAQIAVVSLQLRVPFTVGGRHLQLHGSVAMLPWIGALLVGVWWSARARCRRQLYVSAAWVLCGVASLAKGPAGIGLPALAIAAYLVLAGRWREIFTRLELGPGLLLFAAVAAPWYHAMLARHGMGFYREFIGDNYLQRANGRHGDRGTFEYYLQWLGYGLFPWSGFAALGLLQGVRAVTPPADRDPRRELARFALVWAAVAFAVVTLVATKFHHYILPALPPLAILAGLTLDEICDAPPGRHRFGLLTVALPVTLLAGRDLAALPPRLLWLFNYDYVAAPGVGRAWPSPSIYGDRYEYAALLGGFVLAAALATALPALLRRRPRDAGPAPPLRGRALAALAVLFIAALAVAIASGPATARGAAPLIARAAWLWPAAALLVVATAFALVARRWRLQPVWALAAVALVWSALVADKVLVELSPHWSQKHAIAGYYARRASDGEPLVIWQLKWRGENLYTRNAIHNARNPADRTVILVEHAAEHLTKYLARHPGQRIFFLLERGRLESLRAALPEPMRPSLQVLDDTSNKLYLAAAGP